MQLAAPEALDISKETPEVLKLYGLDHGQREWPKEINALEEIDHFGRKCLVARRLLERGVRFVQIWSGCDNGFPRRNWDSHEDLARNDSYRIGSDYGAYLSSAILSGLPDIENPRRSYPLAIGSVWTIGGVQVKGAQVVVLVDPPRLGQHPHEGLLRRVLRLAGTTPAR